MRSYYPDTARRIQEKRKHSVSFWIMREAGCMMNIRIVSCSITSVTR